MGKNVVFEGDLPDEPQSTEKIKKINPPKLTDKLKKIEKIKNNKTFSKKEPPELENNNIFDVSDKSDDIILFSADSKIIKNEPTKLKNSKQDVTDKQLETEMSIPVNSTMNSAKNLLSETSSNTSEVQNKISNTIKNKRKTKRKKSKKNIRTDKSAKLALENSDSIDDEDLDNEIYLKSCTIPFEQTSSNKLLGKIYIVIIIFTCLVSVINFNWIRLKLIKFINMFKLAKFKNFRKKPKFFRHICIKK